MTSLFCAKEFKNELIRRNSLYCFIFLPLSSTAFFTLHLHSSLFQLAHISPRQLDACFIPTIESTNNMAPPLTRPKVSPTFPLLSTVLTSPWQLPQSKSLVYIDNDLNKSSPANSRPASPVNESDEARTPGRQDSSTPDGNRNVSAPDGKGGPAKINVPQSTSSRHPGERLSFNAHPMGSAVSDSFADDHHHHHQGQPQSAPRTPIGTPGVQSPSISYASSPRRNPHTGTIYNGISAGVIPLENIGTAASAAPVPPTSSPRGLPSPQSLQGQHGMTPGAVGLAGVASRGMPGSPALGARVPEVNAEAEEYYGGKEVWSRSRTYSNVGRCSCVGFEVADGLTCPPFPLILALLRLVTLSSLFSSQRCTRRRLVAPVLVSPPRPASSATPNVDPNKWTKKPCPVTAVSPTTSNPSAPRAASSSTSRKRSGSSWSRKIRMAISKLASSMPVPN